jgi:hypothetical protein
VNNKKEKRTKKEKSNSNILKNYLNTNLKATLCSDVFMAALFIAVAITRNNINYISAILQH